MKKKSILLIGLLALLFGSLNVMYRIVPIAQATYVEGFITQDTLWTPTDSPFILTGNITINPGATLTIEPGVQVRFGGDFSLIVRGQITAQGTDERMIYFTTNDPTSNITWRTIAFMSAQSSSLINCVIEYGKNGTTLESGSLEIQSTIVRFNSENGITVNGGALGVADSQMSSNGASAINIDGGSLIWIANNVINSSGNGVRVAHGDSVSVVNNVIDSNGNGVLLTGSLTGAVDIIQNEISNNTENGIVLESEIYSNARINENNVTANTCGILVSSNASTYVTRNSIWNNTVGMYYSGGARHQAEFNDIYDNGYGMNIDPLSQTSVNATHNYWGNRTGPRHSSLNPFGKGNEVGGDAVNIIIVPFLRHSFTYANNPPTATLWTDKVLVAPFQTITFVGTDSQDDGNVEGYFFDFNDFTNSGWTTLSLYNHSYSSSGTYTANLKTEDDMGWKSGTASTTIRVADLTPLDVQISSGNNTLPYNEVTWVTVYVSYAGVGVPNANVTLFSVRGGVFEQQSGLTDLNGGFGTLFRAPNVTQTTDVRIIARASLNGFADGSDYKYIRVLAPLDVQVEATPDTIISEETTAITVSVTFDSIPIKNATVTISSDVGGNFSETTQQTDPEGLSRFNFTAPLTTNIDGINATITARVSESNYADSEGQTLVTILPKVLSIVIFPDSNTTYSNGMLNFTVHVTYGTTPIQDANITMTSMDGSFVPSTGTTDNLGNLAFTFIAPSTNQPFEMNLSATASKDGFVNKTEEITITVNPRTFTIQITPSTVRSGHTQTIAIYVTSAEDSAPVEGATVTISYANVAPYSNTTDSFGICEFTINVPEMQESQLNLTLKVAKDGYSEKQVIAVLNVLPSEGGFPWLTIILILIPVMVAVVMVILIKFKVIVVSTKEETEE